jgi:hypothetical protein
MASFCPDLNRRCSDYMRTGRFPVDSTHHQVEQSVQSVPEKNAGSYSHTQGREKWITDAATMPNHIVPVWISITLKIDDDSGAGRATGDQAGNVGRTNKTVLL